MINTTVVPQGAGDRMTLKTERSFVDGSVTTLQNDTEVHLKRLIVNVGVL